MKGLGLWSQFDDEVVVRVALKVSNQLLKFGVKKFEFIIAGTSTYE